MSAEERTDTARQEYPAGGVRISGNQDGYDVSCSCRNYTPRSGVRTINMEDYSSCDSCTYLRADMKCGIAQQTHS